MKFEYWSYDCKSLVTYDLNETAAAAFPVAEDNEEEKEEET